MGRRSRAFEVGCVEPDTSSARRFAENPVASGMRSVAPAGLACPDRQIAVKISTRTIAIIAHRSELSRARAAEEGRGRGPQVAR